MIRKKIRNKKGGSTIFEVVICITIITFILFYPIATFSLLNKKNLLQDTLTTTLQSTSLQGGVTNSVVTLTKENIKKKGFDDSKLIVRSNNTNNTNLIYRESDTPIDVEILYPANKEIDFINGLSRIIGANEKSLHFEKVKEGEQYYYKLEGFTLSEKINY